MIIINNGNLGELHRVANQGPFLQAEIISLTGKGKLRVTCNWLYSSLNCDPNDLSSFVWQFNKIDDQHISLSPVNSCTDKTIYASVRDDINYYLQTQAPYSADWITVVARDEIINLVMHDLSIAQFNGFNGLYLTLNDNADRHGNHTGYRVRSIGTTFTENAQWFIGVVGSLQPHIQFSGYSNSIESLQQQLGKNRIHLDEKVLEKINLHINTLK